MKHYSINKTLYRVRDFVSWQKSDALEISPSFQRRPVWSKISKSFLIDTIIKGLPVPIIFLREKITSPDRLEPLREVVDGQQRLRTIFAYISSELLADYDSEFDEFTVRKNHNKEIAGQEFNELSDKQKRLILDYEFSVHILPADVDDREVLQIFARMNSTGVKLNHQEIRNAEYVGEFKDSVYNSAFKQLYNWKNWGLFTDNNISRMLEVEFTSQLYMLLIDGISGREQKKINATYVEYEESLPYRTNIERRFEHIMKLIEDNCPNLIDTCFSNQAYFYVLFAALYDKAYGLNSKLTRSGPNKIPQTVFKKIHNISGRINNDDLPNKLLQLSDARRLNNRPFRDELFKFIRRNL